MFKCRYCEFTCRSPNTLHRHKTRTHYIKIRRMQDEVKLYQDTQRRKVAAEIEDWT